jgi:hypothetical protein
MHRFKLVVFACMAVCMLGAVVVSSASAASVLPEFSPATGGTAASGEGTLQVENTKVTCKTSSDTFGQLSTRLGTFKLDFLTCKSVGEECKGLAQSAGLIELTGEYHLVALKTEPKHFLILFLVPKVHIECIDPINTLVLVSGDVLGLIKPQGGTSMRTFEIDVLTEGAGNTLKQQLTKFTNNTGEEITANLKGSVDGGTERESYENSGIALLFTNEPTELLES